MIIASLDPTAGMFLMHLNDGLSFSAVAIVADFYGKTSAMRSTIRKWLARANPWWWSLSASTRSRLMMRTGVVVSPCRVITMHHWRF